MQNMGRFWRIILKRALNKDYNMAWTGFNWFRVGKVVSPFERINVALGFFHRVRGIS